MPWGIGCALACVLFTAAAADAEAADGSARARPVATEGGSSGAALQARRVERGKLDLERLTADARRKKRRDTWELVIRELDSAFAAAPGGPRAREAAALGARAREELWSASRRKDDAVAAIEAYRRVDELFPGTADAAEALSHAVNLARRIGDGERTTSAARRLAARYPGTKEAASAAPLANFAAKATVAATGGALPAAAPVRPADEKGPVAPVRRADEKSRDSSADAARNSDDRAATSEEAAVDTAAAVGIAAAADARPPLAADKPRSPRAVAPHPDSSEAAAAASRLLDRVIDAARNGAAVVETSEDEDLPPEPEAPDPVAGDVVKQAIPPPADADLDRPEKVERARELRTAALSSKAGSLPEQLGLKIRRVVVDAGHGGRDTGALGPRGTREKDVALAIAKALAVRLKALGFAVVLTRDDDRYLGLDERTRIANDAHADLFVSIHCNAARRRKLSGLETWTLNVASDRFAARLAAFENADADRSASDLRLILADLATRANTDDSREVAQSVQSALVRGLRSRGERVVDHGIKHALFYVLLGARMPAILVETGFISNPAEEARLRSRDRQRAMAEAIAAGVREFADGRRRIARFP